MKYRKKPLVLIVNLFGIILMPLWILPWICFIATQDDKEFKKIMRGEVYFWENL